MTKQSRNESHDPAGAFATNTVSIDGTKSVTVTECSTILFATYTGSRCPSGVAITMEAPTRSGMKKPHSDTSNVVAVFCR
ncbi:hypothetical protein RE9431_36620 [Prescottella equi]|nr:hypothetical protein RE9425_37240 [Prescottella equi]BCN65207.1 hypothetical protein RE9431_36620 [Prescottella equi]